MNGCNCETESQTGCSGTAFVIGTVLGLGTGMALGVSIAPSRRDMRKMAKRTGHTVSEAMDNLRDSLAQYL